MPKERLLTPQEVADYLNVKKSTIYGWTHEEKIPHLKLGNLVRFRKEDIERWLKTRTRKARRRW
ncbi:MAG: helix-turn-helix domain-containing protein [Candidatus Zixiibacteriota bacterium]